MNKFDTFVSILDHIRKSATVSKEFYNPDETNEELVNHARSRAFIHLFLSVKFGLEVFSVREKYVTDGTNDGGIDGYYIDNNNQLIYLIQAKYRTTIKNFEKKHIELEEIVKMDIDRVLDGMHSSDKGVEYNGKIINMINDIRSIDSIARYKYRIVLLANLKEQYLECITKFLSNYKVELFNYNRTYCELIFPFVSGNYFFGGDLFIFLDVTNKNSGVKTSNSVSTQIDKCEISVVFVPTYEIAKTMLKYRNAILHYNPRCYLDMNGVPVNKNIKETIISSSTNEFALFNNGIVILSDGTEFNEKVGEKGVAAMMIKNPQIINGGQTAFTLANILEETKDIEHEPSCLKGKEVLVKVITFLNSAIDPDKKQGFVERLSEATNQQTIVTYADRHSNDRIQKDIQKKIFDKTGLFYERKRGEFNDGIKNGYIKEEQVIQRNEFARVALSMNGVTSKKPQRIYKDALLYDRIFNKTSIDSCVNGIMVYRIVNNYKIFNEDIKKIIDNGSGTLLKYILEKLDLSDDASTANNVEHMMSTINSIINEFHKYVIASIDTRKFIKVRFNPIIGKNEEYFNFAKYYRDNIFYSNLKEFYDRYWV